MSTAQAQRAAPAALYERELAVSVDRIWENVLDWEHLPYLHAQSFTSVRVGAHDGDGWHGLVGLPGGGDAEIDVRLDRAGLCYTTRTVAGIGAGTDIVTQLLPRDARSTAIRVEFHLPWAPSHAREAIGNAYRLIYAQLWDQDDAMMRERQRVLDAAAARSAATQAAAPASIVIGRVRELAARLPLDVELGGRRFRVTSVDGRLVAFDVRCPHLGGPLGEGSLDGCEVVCPWHGYRFDVTTGKSTEGRSLRLASAAVVEVDEDRAAGASAAACDGEVRLRLP